MSKKKPGRMVNLGMKTFENTDLELSTEELEVLANSQIDGEKLAPEITSQEIYSELIKAVEVATQNNESIAELRNRIENIGKEAISLAKKIIDAIP